MLYDKLARIEQYKGLRENLLRGLRYLQETDFSTMEDGRYEIDGDRLFVLVQTYETRLSNDAPESHRAYLDIQYLFEGAELVGVVPIEEIGAAVESHPERDAWFYRGETRTLPIGNGTFMVLWPGDVHAPGIAIDGTCARVRKCVVKVKNTP